MAVRCQLHCIVLRLSWWKAKTYYVVYTRICPWSFVLFPFQLSQLTKLSVHGGHVKAHAHMGSTKLFSAKVMMTYGRRVWFSPYATLCVGVDRWQQDGYYWLWYSMLSKWKQSFLKVKIPFTTVQLALQTLLPHLVARCTLGYYMVSWLIGLSYLRNLQVHQCSSHLNLSLVSY